MAAETVVWLWPEGRYGEHLRGWMPDETCCFPKLAETELVIRDSAGNRIAVAISRLAGGTTAPDLLVAPAFDCRFANRLATLPLRMADAGWRPAASSLASLA